MHADLETALGILIVAVLVDVLLGEYFAALHPVVWIGTLITGLLKLAPASGWWRQFAFGLFLVVVVVGVCVGLTWLALELANRVPYLEILVGAFLLKASFALRELGEAAGRVERAVQAGNLDAARQALRALCSRDPRTLDREHLLAAAVQSLAENACDSVVAPLFYYLLLGVPGAVGYRALNTLDSRVGYRGPFEALGKAAARLDDVVNWIPARLTAGLLLLAGWVSRKKVAAGWRMLRRDGAKTPSPNGGRPMAVMAGLLGVRLEKPGAYALGDAEAPLTPATVREARRLVNLGGWVMMALCGLGVAAISYLSA